MPRTGGTKASAKADKTQAASRREQRRLLHQDLSRNQLLDAAEEVFGEKGFHDTTLKEVAELAEFSVGSVYSFFENKDDLFLNVFLRRGAEFLPSLFGFDKLFARQAEPAAVWERNQYAVFHRVSCVEFPRMTTRPSGRQSR